MPVGSRYPVMPVPAAAATGILPASSGIAKTPSRGGEKNEEKEKKKGKIYISEQPGEEGGGKPYSANRVMGSVRRQVMQAARLLPARRVGGWGVQLVGARTPKLGCSGCWGRDAGHPRGTPVGNVGAKPVLFCFW